MEKIKISKTYEAILLTFDYVGSTKISKELDFEQTADFYQIPLNIFTEIIEEHEGYPWKYIGDQIIVIYNVSQSFLEIADLSLKCAIRLIMASNEIISPLLKEINIDNFSIRISIDAGRLIPIVINRKNKPIYDLAGVTINRLAKICSKTEKNQILIGDNFFNLIHASNQKLFKKSSKKANNFEKYNLWEYTF